MKRIKQEVAKGTKHPLAHSESRLLTPVELTDLQYHGCLYNFGA